jgi:hypothetical protein
MRWAAGYLLLLAVFACFWLGAFHNDRDHDEIER